MNKLWRKSDGKEMRVQSSIIWSSQVKLKCTKCQSVASLNGYPYIWTMQIHFLPGKYFIMFHRFLTLLFEYMYWFLPTLKPNKGFKFFIKMLAVRAFIKILVVRHRSGPSCSKLMTWLVDISLKFQTLIPQICQYFCQIWKAFALIFPQKFQSIWL